MSSKSYNLRLRTPLGQKTLQLDEGATFGEFVSNVKSLLNEGDQSIIKGMFFNKIAFWKNFRYNYISDTIIFQISYFRHNYISDSIICEKLHLHQKNQLFLSFHCIFLFYFWIRCHKITLELKFQLLL